MHLRILHISTRLILGGSQENTILSCEGQAKLGHEVHLAYGPIYGPEGSMLDRVRTFNAACQAEGFSDRVIRTHEVPHLVREVHPLADRACLRELRELISALKPDVVHTHSSKAGILGRAAAWKCLKRNRTDRPAVVHTIHGPPFMPVEGTAMKRLRIGVMNGVYTLAERQAAKRCHLIVCVADAMASQFLARRIGRADQYVTVYSGMEIEPFLTPAPDQTRAAVRASLGLTESDFVVGTVARLAEHKGHDDILDALGQHMRTHPEFKLLWVGDGWWAGRLRDRVESLGLSGQVICTGLVDPGRVPGLMRAMDVLCHPSSREGLPRTVPQALLCGVCPVAYDVDGTGEVCREMETGRLVKPGNIAELRDALLWAHSHPAERDELAQRGRAECRQRFDVRNMIAALEEVYARALELA